MSERPSKKSLTEAMAPVSRLSIGLAIEFAQKRGVTLKQLAEEMAIKGDIEIVRAALTEAGRLIDEYTKYRIMATVFANAAGMEAAASDSDPLQVEHYRKSERLFRATMQ